MAAIPLDRAVETDVSGGSKLSRQRSIVEAPATASEATPVVLLRGTQAPECLRSPKAPCTWLAAAAHVASDTKVSVGPQSGRVRSSGWCGVATGRRRYRDAEWCKGPQGYPGFARRAPAAGPLGTFSMCARVPPLGQELSRGREAQKIHPVRNGPRAVVHCRPAKP